MKSENAIFTCVIEKKAHKRILYMRFCLPIFLKKIKSPGSINRNLSKNRKRICMLRFFVIFETIFQDSDILDILSSNCELKDHFSFF